MKFKGADGIAFALVSCEEQDVSSVNHAPRPIDDGFSRCGKNAQGETWRSGASACALGAWIALATAACEVAEPICGTRRHRCNERASPAILIALPAS
jgi:hypothetical protein